MEKFFLVSLLSLLIAAAHGVSGSTVFDNFGMFEELNSLSLDIEEDTEVETSDIPSWTSERGGKVLVNIDSFGAAGNGESDDTEEKLEEWLHNAKKLIDLKIDKKSETFKLCDFLQVKKVLAGKLNSAKQVSEAVENMLVTGRLFTQTGLDLPQTAGYTVQADRLNFLRFLSHFRSVHRGSSFAGHRSTTVRKLLPESWGFLCPVHTHEGGPCGLLDHMTCNCRITSRSSPPYSIKRSILNIVKKIGGTQSVRVIDPKLDPRRSLILPKHGLPKVLHVLLDGCIISFISSLDIDKVVARIRQAKISSSAEIPNDLEVGYVPLSMGGAYPGLYLFTTPGRFIRPVRNITIPSNESGNVELIGPFEQVFMEIRCPDGGDGRGKDPLHVTHEEICPTGMLSVVANLTPWSDHNQSPQNIYQCQVQSSFILWQNNPFHFTNQYRADKKSYCLQSPQSPIVRTRAYSRYNMDEFPTGTNAIVAVLAYTGYDMEDAMILNKSSVERGMFHGQIYQTETLDLTKQRRIFRKPLDRSCSTIDSDGLPHVGQMIQLNEPYCITYEEETASKGKYICNGSEPLYVDYVSLDVKDKKRHLQKGGSLGGQFVDATPFHSSMKKDNEKSGSESGSLVDDLGVMLRKKGFNYHGSEVLYSGVYGTELTCEIFIGPVYYQRLRHMVSDKLVRSTGTIEPAFRQPKKGESIRFGEMERDSLLAHGAAYLLHDRLHTCSDYHLADVCTLCGSMLSRTFIRSQKRPLSDIGVPPPVRVPKKVTCRACQTSKGMEQVAMPYVFRCLAAELAAMNIKMTLKLTD